MSETTMRTVGIVFAVLIVSEILDSRFQFGARSIAGTINSALPV